MHLYNVHTPLWEHKIAFLFCPDVFCTRYSDSVQGQARARREKLHKKGRQERFDKKKERVRSSTEAAENHKIQSERNTLSGSLGALVLPIILVFQSYFLHLLREKKCG